jgi:hypothetical protein
VKGHSVTKVEWRKSNGNSEESNLRSVTLRNWPNDGLRRFFDSLERKLQEVERKLGTNNADLSEILPYILADKSESVAPDV